MPDNKFETAQYRIDRIDSRYLRTINAETVVGISQQHLEDLYHEWDKEIACVLIEVGLSHRQYRNWLDSE